MVDGKQLICWLESDNPDRIDKAIKEISFYKDKAVESQDYDWAAIFRDFKTHLECKKNLLKSDK